MYDTAISIPRQSGEHVVRELAMKCTPGGLADTQLPWAGLQRRENKPDGWWIAAGAFFDGQVLKFSEYGELGEPSEMEITEADAGLCLFDGRLLVVVKPSDQKAPAIWIGENAGNITVETAGSQGIAGRPFEITLKTSDWTLKLIEIARVFRRWTTGSNIDETLQTGQESSLAKAIAGAVGVEQRFPMERLDPGSLSDSSTYQWQRPAELAGLWRLYRAGEPSVISWVVDRNHSDEEQATDLEQLDWMPKGIRERMIEQARGQREQTKLWFPELPPGRLQLPYPGINPVVGAEGDEPRHPARDYLWPSISTGGVPVLEPGETMVQEWTPPTIEVNYFMSTQPNGPGRTTVITAGEYMVYLTDRRLIQVSRIDPAAKGNENSPPWSIGHLRWEWVSSVGRLRKQILKRGGFLGGKEQLVDELEGLFVRETFANTSFCDFYFPGELDSAGPITELIGTIEDLIAQGSEREIMAVEQMEEVTEFASRRVRDLTPITGSVPYSIPDHLG